MRPIRVCLILFTLAALLTTVPSRAQTLTKEEKDDGFVSLFNGNDFSGWKGNKDSFGVDEGAIFTRRGVTGLLFSEKEHKNFILRYDVFITEGTNSGVGIRSPGTGNPYLNAIEIQVLDNNSPLFKNDKNRHSSICTFGQAPDLDVPLEKWHATEVIANGRRVQVKHNGKLIADADLNEPKAKAHQGAQRTGGHIVLMCQKGRAEFKNIRIKELP